MSRKKSRLELCVSCKSTQARIRGLETERAENLRTMERANKTIATIRAKLAASTQDLAKLQAAWDNRHKASKKGK